MGSGKAACSCHETCSDGKCKKTCIEDGKAVAECGNFKEVTVSTATACSCKESCEGGECRKECQENGKVVRSCGGVADMASEPSAQSFALTSGKSFLSEFSDGTSKKPERPIALILLGTMAVSASIVPAVFMALRRRARDEYVFVDGPCE